MPKNVWEYHTAPATTSEDEAVSLRVERSGRGKNKIETWQRQVSEVISLDGTPEELIAKINRYSEGLISPYFGTYEERDDYDGETYTETRVTGWVEETNEEVIEAVVGFAQRAAEAQELRARERAERELARIQKQYPDLVNVDTMNHVNR